MVFLTSVCQKYMPFWYRRPSKASRFMRKLGLFRFTQFFYGRQRNVFKNAMIKWTKSIQYQQIERKKKIPFFHDVYSQRVLAAVEEHGFAFEYFTSFLEKSGIILSKKSLSTLAIYEPRTFKALVDIAKTKYHEDGETEKARNFTPPPGVITRGML